MASFEYSIGPGSRWRRGAGLIAMGFIFTVLGLVATNDCLMFQGPGCGAPILFLVLGILLIAGGIVLVAFGGRRRPALGYNPAVPPPLLPFGATSNTPPAQVTCRYCGSVSDAGLPRCPNCGAPR